jgi:hypothetical protein
MGCYYGQRGCLTIKHAVFWTGFCWLVGAVAGGCLVVLLPGCSEHRGIILYSSNNPVQPWDQGASTWMEKTRTIRHR